LPWSGDPASADAMRDCHIEAASAMSFSVVRTCAQACAAFAWSCSASASTVSSSRPAIIAGAYAAALVATASSSIFRRSQRWRSAASLVNWNRSRVRMKSASVLALSCHRITTSQPCSAFIQASRSKTSGLVRRSAVTSSVAAAMRSRTDASSSSLPTPVRECSCASRSTSTRTRYCAATWSAVK